MKFLDIGMSTGRILWKILIDVGPILIVVWATNKTFKAEREASIRQFLDESQIENTEMVLTIIKSSHKILNQANEYINQEVEDRNKLLDSFEKNSPGSTFIYIHAGNKYKDMFTESINEVGTLLESMDLYIYFTPELKNDLKKIKLMYREFKTQAFILFDSDKKT